MATAKRPRVKMAPRQNGCGKPLAAKMPRQNVLLRSLYAVSFSITTHYNKIFGVASVTLAIPAPAPLVSAFTVG
jgi:hypothetical protein